MKRKIFAVAFSIAAGACLALALSACSGRSVELVFKLNEETDTYTAYIDHMGTTSGKLEIPAVYNGKPVTALGYDSQYSYFEVEIKSIVLPDSVTEINAEVFERCGDVKKVSVSKDNPVYHSEGNCLIETATDKLVFARKKSVIPDSVKSIGDYAFVDCSDLKSITLPSGVTSIGGYAFKDCDNLSSITLPSGVTSIGEYAFSSCYHLTQINLPDSLASLGSHAFEFCDITDIRIPAATTSIGGQAFYTCRKVESITVAQGNPVYDSAGNCLIEKETNTLIAGCQNSVIPDEVTAIGDYAFYACFGLGSISIPSRVTSIGSSAFEGCLALKKVEFGISVTSIKMNAFGNCDSLTAINYLGRTTDWKEIKKEERWRWRSYYLTSVVCSDGTLTEDEID